MRIRSMPSRLLRLSLFLCCLSAATNSAFAQQTGPGVLPGSRPAGAGGAVTGPILFPDGTAAAPSITFASDPTKGWFKTGGSVRLVSDDFTLHNAGGVYAQIYQGVLAFGGAGVIDAFLVRDAANTLAQRNGTTAQNFRIYKTYIDASNYERLWLGGDVNGFFIDAGSAGTGVTQPLRFNVGNATRWQITTAGHLLAGADNTLDIGAIGATRPRTIYAGTALVIGDNPATTADIRGRHGLLFYGRNSTNAVNRVLLDWGSAAADTLTVGDPSTAIRINGTSIRWGVPLVALGAGAAPTLGTIGGSGPTVAAQNSWMQVVDSAGATFWVPVWK